MLDADHTLTRLIWTDRDFEVMPWHDCTIYAFWSDDTTVDLLMDMDYKCAWVQSAVAQHPFSFYIAPATLAFHGATDIRFSLESVANPLKLNAVRREDRRAIPGYPVETWHWTLEGHHGLLTMRALGYTLYFRQQPTLLDAQRFTYAARGGISFARGAQP